MTNEFNRRTIACAILLATSAAWSAAAEPAATCPKVAIAPFQVPPAIADKVLSQTLTDLLLKSGLDGCSYVAVVPGKGLEELFTRRRAKGVAGSEHDALALRA